MHLFMHFVRHQRTGHNLQHIHQQEYNISSMPRNILLIKHHCKEVDWNMNHAIGNKVDVGFWMRTDMAVVERPWISHHP